MRHLLTFACFAAAILCYILANQPGAVALFVVGGLLELVGWRRIVNRGRKT